MLGDLKFLKASLIVTIVEFLTYKQDSQNECSYDHVKLITYYKGYL